MRMLRIWLHDRTRSTAKKDSWLQLVLSIQILTINRWFIQIHWHKSTINLDKKTCEILFKLKPTITLCKVPSEAGIRQNISTTTTKRNYDPEKKNKKKTLLSFHTSTLFFCAYAHCPCSVIWLRLWHKHLVPVSFTLSMIECLLHACESVAASQLIVALCTVKQTKRTQKLRSHSKFKLEMINICDYWSHLMWEWMPVSPSQDKK